MSTFKRADGSIEIPRTPVKREIMSFAKETRGTLGGSRSIEAQGIPLSRYYLQGS